MTDITGEFRDFIHSQLEVLDARLSSANQPVHSRPMLAAMQFVTGCVARIGDEEVGDDFLLRDWFGDILSVTTKWYRTRYGDELLETPGDKIQGVVAAFGTALDLRIPRISEFDTAKAAIKRIVFADGILDEEDPMDWVSPTPIPNAFSAETAQEFRQHVFRVSIGLRQICRRLMVADFSSTEEQELASSVEGHLEKAAVDIQSKRHGAAVWELHLCIEKVLKLLLRQAGASVPKSHDLSKLVTAAEQVGLSLRGHANLQTLPPHDDALRHRYAELPAPTFERIVEIYDAAIQVTAHVAGALRQNSFFSKHKELYIQALPWHPKWKQSQPANSDV